jgi:hypothetical protein
MSNDFNEVLPARLMVKLPSRVTLAETAVTLDASMFFFINSTLSPLRWKVTVSFATKVIGVFIVMLA